MRSFISRFSEVEQSAACSHCRGEFIVVSASLFLKVFKWTRYVMFCPFCGKPIDWEGFKESTPVKAASDPA